MGIFDRKPNVEKLKAKGNLKGLIKALNYKSDRRIRKAAAEALGHIGDPRVVKFRGGKSAIADLTKYMGLMGVATFDEVQAVREGAARGIVKIGKPALPVLRGDDPIAVWILGEIGDERAIAALIQTMKSKYALLGVTRPL